MCAILFSGPTIVGWKEVTERGLLTLYLVRTGILAMMTGKEKGAPQDYFIDNIKNWTTASLEENVRVTDDRT